MPKSFHWNFCLSRSRFSSFTSVFPLLSTLQHERNMAGLSMMTLAFWLALQSPAHAWNPNWTSSHSSYSHSTSQCSTTTPYKPTSTTPATCSATRTTSYGKFSYTALTTTRYATPLPSPLTLTTTYAPPFSKASTLLPPNPTYTTYSLNRSATAVQDGQYGQGAYARLWTLLSYNVTVPFTTTATPTPIASSELVYPPPLYTACPKQADACLDCYKLPKDFQWGVAGSAWQIEGGQTEDGRGTCTHRF